MLSLVNAIQTAHETERRAELLELNRHIKHLQRELRRARDRRDAILDESERQYIDSAVDLLVDGDDGDLAKRRKATERAIANTAWQPTGSLDQETAGNRASEVAESDPSDPPASVRREHDAIDSQWDDAFAGGGHFGGGAA